LYFLTIIEHLHICVFLSAHIDLNSQSVSHLDTVFEIIYSDKENDSLKYEYVYTDIETNLNTTYFLGDSNGNTHSKLVAETIFDDST
jgi:hypothetical protein